MYPNEAWIVHRDELEVLGVQFVGRLEPNEEIEAIIDVLVYDAVGNDVTDDVLDGTQAIADYTDPDDGTVYSNAAIHFTKMKAVGAAQPAGEYRVEIEGRTTTGRELVALMRDRKFPALLIVDGLSP